MTPPRVMIGMPIASGSLPWPTAVSLISTIRWLDREGLEFKIEAPTGNSVVQWARSLVADAFLKTDFTHLFWIDSDIVWTPDDFFKLLGFGAIYDLVGASYPLKKEPTQFLINFPTPGKIERNGHDLLRIASMAIGFTLMTRQVVEKVAADKPLVHDRANDRKYLDIFRVDRTIAGGPRGEDIAFYNDATALGFEAWLDPAISLGHEGRKIYRGDVNASLGLSTKEPS